MLHYQLDKHIESVFDRLDRQEFERLPGISNRENDWVQMLLKTGQITPEYSRLAGALKAEGGGESGMFGALAPSAPGRAVGGHGCARYSCRACVYAWNEKSKPARVLIVESLAMRSAILTRRFSRRVNSSANRVSITSSALASPRSSWRMV
jgi:hypothetical protein